MGISAESLSPYEGHKPVHSYWAKINFAVCLTLKMSALNLI